MSMHLSPTRHPVRRSSVDGAGRVAGGRKRRLDARDRAAHAVGGIPRGHLPQRTPVRLGRCALRSRPDVDALIVAETIASNTGIGYLAMNAREFMQMYVVVLCILLYALLGVLSDLIARGLERALLVWRVQEASVA
jgi:hypothetical protein